METKFKTMYKIMGVIGDLMGVAGAVFAIYKDIVKDNAFYFLLMALLTLLILTTVLMILKSRGKFQNVSYVNASIAKGHISMMIGVCILITAFMFANGHAFSTVLAIILIVAVFMSIMLYFMINTFKRIMDMVKESEKK